MILIDFREAYDSIEHEFLHRALREVGLGSIFTQYVQAIYRDGEA